MNTHPEKWRVALPIVAHGKVVWFGPQDLHNVLIELCLFLLQKEKDECLPHCIHPQWLHG